jgi:hypothetical protein
MFHEFLNFYDPNAPPSKLVEIRDKMRAKGRKHFIFYIGMLGWGAPIFVLSMLSSWHEKYGWHAAPRADLLLNFIEIAFLLALWLTFGYLFGARIWRKMGLEEATTVRPNSMIEAILGKRPSALSRLRLP